MIKNIKKLTALALICGAVFSLSAGSLGEIAAKMRARECYRSTARYEILLPNFSEPVAYTIRLESAAPTDTLAPCKYVIDWTLKTPAGDSEGFAAYFDGTHFRFRDARMQEYHVEEGIETFAPGGDTAKGVQNIVQFADLLPAYIARQFEIMEADSTYIYKVTEGAEVKVTGVRRIAGYESSEYEYVLDGKTMMPVRIDLETNPGQIAEQSMTITYSDTQFPEKCVINLETLSEAKSVEFEKYRSNFFSLEQMPGNPLPQIVGKTLSGERFVRNRGEASPSPTILVFVDSGVGTTPEVVKAVREARDFLPMNVDVIWAFLNRRHDDITAIIGSPQPGETVLVNATSAARECGVGALTPVIIYVAPEGKVTDFTRGFNQDLRSVVIQSAGLSNSTSNE